MIIYGIEIDYGYEGRDICGYYLHRATALIAMRDRKIDGRFSCGEGIEVVEIGVNEEENKGE